MLMGDTFSLPRKPTINIQFFSESLRLFLKKVRILLNYIIKFGIITIAIGMADLPAVRLAGSGEPQVVSCCAAKSYN